MNRILTLTSSLLLTTQLAFAADGPTPITPLTGNVIIRTGDGSNTVTLRPEGAGGTSTGPFQLDFQPLSTKTIKATFLGLTVTTVSPDVRGQIDLPPDVGLLVASVGIGSPAESAGVQQYDILQQLNDQLLIEPRQLGVLVRLAKPGDKITLKLLRKGAPLTLTATLIQKDLPPLDPETRDLNFSDWVPNNPSNLESAVQRAARDAAIGNLTAHPLPNKQFPPFHGFQLLHNGGGSGSLNYSDKSMTLELNQHDSDLHLTAKDPNQKILFDGPINTDQQRKALPPEVAKRLNQLNIVPPATQPSAD